MMKSSRHSKGKATVIYLGAITMIGVAALSTGVALGLLINTHSYMHFQAVNGSNAKPIASNQSTYAFSGTATSNRR
jgi:hypothetical protein